MAEQQGVQAQALQTQAAQQPFTDLQNLSTLNTNVQQMPQVQAQAATATPLMFQSAATTSQTEAPTAKASDFANLLGTNVTSTSVDDLTLTQQVVAAPQNSGSSLGDFLKGSSQQPGQAMTEMLQTSDGTESVTQLPEEAAFDKAPTTQEAVPTQAGITSFAQTLQNIDGTQQATQTAQAAQQPQTDYDIPQQIVDQARLIQRGQDTEMVIHLKPEHLGDLTLRVSVGVDGAVNASFHSNNAEVRTIIENTLVQLKQDLNDQGIKVDNVGVYAGLADGGLPQDSGQQGWQQGSSQGQHHSTQESAEAFEDGQELAAALVVRSARLVTATYVGIIWQLAGDEAIKKQHIAIDGSVYEKMPLAKENIMRALSELLGESAPLVDTVLENGGSGLGAAIAAAMSQQQA